LRTQSENIIKKIESWKFGSFKPKAEKFQFKKLKPKSWKRVLKKPIAASFIIEESS